MYWCSTRLTYQCFNHKAIIILFSRGKLQKHLNYEQELKANKNRLDDINVVGASLVKEKHYAAPHVQERLSEVNGMWDELVDATAKKGAKLKEAGDQQQFNRS